MSTLEVAAVVAASAWLAVLSLVAILVVRQTALLTLRADRAEGGASLDGLPLGRALPQAAARAVGDASETTHALILSANCSPCRELADAIADVADLPPRVVAIVSGERNLAEALASRLPAAMPVFFDPIASEAIDSLNLSTTPFAFTFAEGRVANKVGLRGGQHFLTFLAGQTGDAASPPSVLQSPNPVEVTHVN
jgi:hypothetical protein